MYFRTKKYYFRSCLCIILSIILMLPIHTHTDVLYAAANINNREDFTMMLYETFLGRAPALTIRYTGADSDVLYKELDQIIFIEVAKLHDVSSSDDVDYICGNLARYKCQYYKYDSYTQFVFEFSYHETIAETQVVNSQVQSIVSKLDLNQKTTYDKVKTIHDYIVKNVSYDTTCQNYSAYSALIKRTSVCNGYALLAYKMLTYANIPCKYVTGYVTSNGTKQEHAWNLVNVDGNWYNMDITWDDMDKNDEILYTYFLKGSEEFNNDHIRHERYNYAAFQIMCPVFEKDYTIETVNDIMIAPVSKTSLLSLDDISLSFTKKTLKKGKKASLTIKNKSNLKAIAHVYYKSTKSKIASVTSNGRISARKKGKTDIKTTVVLVDGQKKNFTAKITVKN